MIPVTFAREMFRLVGLALLGLRGCRPATAWAPDDIGIRSTRPQEPAKVPAVFSFPPQGAALPAAFFLSTGGIQEPGFPGEW